MQGLPEDAIRLRLNPDETLGYYARYFEDGTYEIQSATRTERHQAFRNGAFVSTNDAGWDLSPSVTADGLFFYFESQRGTATGAWRIHRSVWDDQRQGFSTAVPAPGLRDGISDGVSDGGPYTLPSGRVLYFHSTRFPEGTSLARADSNGVKRVNVVFDGESPESMSFPVVTPDELTLYFTAHIPGTLADIWLATRSSTSEPFGTATRVLELSTENYNETPSFISEDGCRLYFDRSSTDPPSWDPGDQRGLVAERQPDVE